MRIFHKDHPRSPAANWIYAFLCTFAVLGAERLFSLFEEKSFFDLTFKRALGFFLFFLVLSLVRRRAGRVFVYALLALFSLGQMGHIAYFGNLAFPFELWLMFSQWAEVQAAFGALGTAIWQPLLVWAMAAMLLFGAETVWAWQMVPKRWGAPLLVFLLLFAPLRTALTDDVFGKRPNVAASALYNGYTTTSYFLAKVLPHKAFGDSTADTGPVEPFKPPLRQSEANVVLILGESLATKHLSLFGSPIQTTPFLESLKKDPAFAYQPALSCGVSTDVAVPLFFNQACRPGALAQIVSTNGCLFRLAKEAGYETHFYSGQAGVYMKGIRNYLCPKYLDHYLDAYDLSEEEDYGTGVFDQKLLGPLEAVDLGKKQFIVLHQRASHFPYRDVYPPEFERLKAPEDETEDQARLRHYRNSVSYSDWFYAQVLEHLRARSTGPTYVVWTSDHGEALGEGGRWGHLMLEREQFEVPFMVYKIGANFELAHKLREKDRYFTHLEIGQFIAYLLGYNERPWNAQTKHQVVGIDLGGQAGWLELILEDDQITETKRID